PPRPSSLRSNPAAARNVKRGPVPCPTSYSTTPHAATTIPPTKTPEEPNFTKKGAGFNNEWHYNHEGSKKLMVSASGEQVPQNLRYKTFFYNACSSGPHYVENFQHGEFVYTNRTCHVFWATLYFVK